jgi:Membrane MotB of proton-channel complex MotA/MotB
MRGKTDRKGKGNILIRKEEVVEGEGHGGAWKVAYADFVTAMMAFFLLSRHARKAVGFSVMNVDRVRLGCAAGVIAHFSSTTSRARLGS